MLNYIKFHLQHNGHKKNAKISKIDIYIKKPDKVTSLSPLLVLLCLVTLSNMANTRIYILFN
jgi:hypothetical protein